MFIWGLFKDLRSENGRHRSRWCRIWQDHMQLVPGLGKCGAAGMRRLPPLVLWFEVCIFPLSRAGPRGVGVEPVQLLRWQPPDPSWTSPPLSSVYLLPLVPLGYVKYLHSEKSDVSADPSALSLQPIETKTVSCHLHAICIGSPVTVCNVRRPN